MTSERHFPNAPDPEGVNLFCDHLTTDKETDGHVRYYLSVGANYALVCSLCLTVYQDEAYGAIEDPEDSDDFCPLGYSGNLTASKRTNWHVYSQVGSCRRDARGDRLRPKSACSEP